MVAECTAKVTKLAAIATTRRYRGQQVNAVVLYGDRTGSKEYDDSTAREAVAAFMLVRAEYWFISMPTQLTLESATARLLLSDYREPRGNMTKVPEKRGVFQRIYE